MANGRTRIILGEITQRKLKGKALIKALGQLNEDEKKSTYQNTKFSTPNVKSTKR